MRIAPERLRVHVEATGGSEGDNANNNPSATAYRNVEGKGSTSASARYLVKLLREVRAADSAKPTES